MNSRKKLNERKQRRGNRVRATIIGTAERPRLSVYRSNRALYAQLIDDEKGRTILSASSAKVVKKGTKTVKSTAAFAVGEALGKEAVEKGIKSAKFDRSSYKFHGRVKQFADGAKKAGLKI
jgi:large subunit ribosomal protein L18